jgi:hypothetical protein
VRGALETLLHALTTEDPMREERGQVQAGMVNSELLAREPDSIALILSLLVRSINHPMCILRVIGYVVEIISKWRCGGQHLHTKRLAFQKDSVHNGKAYFHAG